MTPLRAYVPSQTLIRALQRPQAIRCRAFRPIPSHTIRGKRSKAATTIESRSKQPATEKLHPRTFTEEEIDSIETELRNAQKADDDDEMTRPWTDKELEATDLPVINWYEQDLDGNKPRRLMRRLETVEDWKRDQEMYRMMVESQKNPDYDNAQLNKRLLDSLITNPNFADLADELSEMKQDIKTKEELKAMEEEAEKKAEPELQQLSASLRMGAHELFQNLINDPVFSNAKDELQEVMDKMPEMEEFDSPDFQDVLVKAMVKIDKDPVMQEKMKALAEGAADPKFEKEWADFQKATDEMDEVNENNTSNQETDIEDVDQLLHQMRDVLKSMGGDNELESELDEVLNEDSAMSQEDENPGQFDREMDPEELATEIKKLAQSEAPLSKDDEEDIPADLRAKVDKIMGDPRLMEKLIYIQKLIEERRRTDPTLIPHETAPDPYKLDASRTATLKERMDAVRRDPEHLEALQRLRVVLQPPFNISPSLKSFNQAIELAYVGANDDIRRILWRAYQKCRTLPTFLQNMSDDAWDILYYSQAVTWGSNQNRQAHLRTLLADLKSMGRDGPPTHPSTLVSNDNSDNLES